MITAILMQGIYDHQENLERMGVVGAMKEEPAQWLLGEDAELMCLAVDVAPDKMAGLMNTPDLVGVAKAQIRGRRITTSIDQD